MRVSAGAADEFVAAAELRAGELDIITSKSIVPAREGNGETLSPVGRRMHMVLFILFGLLSAGAIARYGLPLWFAAVLRGTATRMGLHQTREDDRIAVESACRGISRGVLVRMVHPGGGWVRSCQNAKARGQAQMVEGVGFAHAALSAAAWRRAEGPIPGKTSAKWAWPLHFGLGMWSAARYGRNYEEVLRLAQSADAWFRYVCLDGYGFKHGLLDFPRHRSSVAHFHAIPGYYRRAAFQGFGRALYLTHPGDRRALFELIGDVAPEHDSDMIEGAAFASVYYEPDRAVRAMRLARAVPYEWRPHAHLGIVLGFRVVAMVDPVVLNTALGTLSSAGAEAIRHAIHIADETEERIRNQHPVSGYGLWRESLAHRLEKERVLEPLYIEESAEGRRGNRGLVS